MTVKPTAFDHLTPPSLRDGHRPYVLQTARIGHNSGEIKRLFLRDPDNCPNETLPLLIAEYSLEEFIEPGLVESAIRALLKAAPRLHQIKGKPPGIRYALDQIGLKVQFTDWFEAVPEMAAGTHEIFIDVGANLFENEAVVGPKTINQIWRLINEMKRWSQKTYLRIGVNYFAEIGFAPIVATASIGDFAGQTINTLTRQGHELGGATIAASASIAAREGQILNTLTEQGHELAGATALHSASIIATEMES